MPCKAVVERVLQHLAPRTRSSDCTVVTNGAASETPVNAELLAQHVGRLERDGVTVSS